MIKICNVSVKLITKNTVRSIFKKKEDMFRTSDYKYHNAPLHFQSGRNMAAHCFLTVFLFTIRLSVFRPTEEEIASIRGYSCIF